MDFYKANQICQCRRCNGIVYVIKSGDTLYRVSRQYKVSLEDILDANPDINVYNLQPGDRICIPVPRPEPRMAPRMPFGYEPKPFRGDAEIMPEEEMEDWMEPSFRNRMDSAHSSEMDSTAGESENSINRNGMRGPITSEAVSDLPEPETPEGHYRSFQGTETLAEVLDELGIRLEDFNKKGTF